MAERQHAGDYRILSFDVYSHRHQEKINIAQHVDELEIYENINNPYLTGTFSMKDDMRFYDGVGINGTEVIEITLESPENPANTILRRFSIVKITSTAKAADNIEVLEIKIAENSLFNNNLMQINKVYSGTPDIIVAKILKDNLNLDVDLPLVKPYQKSLKVVIPYMTPFDAALWVCSMMSTRLGLPYFLFATLNDVPESPEVPKGVNIQLKSLEEMLRNPAWNKNSPYRFSASYNQATSTLASDNNMFNVGAYSGFNKENVFSLMASGSTAGLHSITDATTGQLIDYHFDVDTLFKSLSDMEIIDTDHEPVFHSKYDFNGKPMYEYNTFNSHIIVSNQTYNGISNIYEETSTGAYRLHACKNALQNMIMKSSINIRVPGIMFMTGYNASIGRQIDFIYPANNTNIRSQSTVSDEDTVDRMRSGTYVIYTARHHFNNTQHNVDMSCVKLGNRKVRG
jgi:hypothetical protein